MDRNINNTQSNYQSKVLGSQGNQAQKIVTAIYMLTDFIDEQDPVRKDLRVLSVKILSLINGLVILSPSEAQRDITNIQYYIDQVVDLLKVCVSIGFVSDMNYKILSDTMARLRDRISHISNTVIANSAEGTAFRNRSVEEFVLPGYLVDDTEETLRSSDLLNTQKDNTARKGHFKKEQTNHKRQVTQNNNQSSSTTKQPSVQKVKTSDREQHVFDAVARMGEVSVGDIAKEFSEVSEKTIQRILVKLVDQGRLDKKGEKRWSRYFVL